MENNKLVQALMAFWTRFSTTCFDGKKVIWTQSVRNNKNIENFFIFIIAF